MSHIGKIEAAPADRFTAEQAQAILRASEIETDLRLRLANGPFDGFTRRLAIKTYLADVKRFAVGVLDDLAGNEGFEDSHDELHAELEVVNVHRLWDAMRHPEAYLPEDHFTTPRVSHGMGGVA